MTAGTAYRNKGFIHCLTFLPFPLLASSTNLSQPQPNRLQQNSAIIRDPKGSTLVDTIKSQKSSHVVPSAKGQEMKGAESKPASQAFAPCRITVLCLHVHIIQLRVYAV